MDAPANTLGCVLGGRAIHEAWRLTSSIRSQSTGQLSASTTQPTLAALAVIVDRDRGEFNRTRRLGAVRFEQAVRRESLRRGGQKPCRRIAAKLVAALADPAGVIAARAGAVERVQLLLADWQHAQQREGCHFGAGL